MKNYIIYLISILAMSLLLACDRGGEFELCNNTLALTLSCSDITRADADVDPLNENKIVSLDCFFYAASPDATTADFDAPSLAHRRISSISAIGEHTTYISFTEEEITNIFVDVTGRTNSTCFIYVIANRPESVALPATPAGPSINQLKALTIQSDFQTYTTPQSSFFMDSEGNDEVTLTINNNNGTKTLSGEVELRRTAAKISFTISRFGSNTNNIDTVVIDGKTYKPNYEGIYVIFNNCVYRSHIAPDVVSNSNIGERYCDVGSETNDAAKIKMQTTGGHSPCTLSKPFYSYPSEWSATEENDAYISLIVPWTTVVDGVTQFTSYHYKVPINYDKDKIERNIHYKISVQISVLGTVDPDDPIEIDPSYVVFDCLEDWNSDPINADMTNFRYLMVEENSYVLNNVDEIEIPYWTSHPCKIVNAKITQADIKTGGDKTISNPELYITLEDDKIIYSKVLDNNYMSKTFDFAPYTIEFTIQHITDSTYKEKITITQYPAIYGDYEENSDYTNGKDNNNKGFVYVNGYQGNDNTDWDENNDWFFGSVPGNSNRPMQSPNRYIFTITSVEGTDYIIGDPREMTPTFGSTSAKWSKGGRIVATDDKNVTLDTRLNYTLNNYYGTDGSERTRNMIAPKFMLASGYALLSPSVDAGMNKLEQLKKRCASYQEDGYPAGRWRLPTQAEFQFIMSQVAKKTLPDMYVRETAYWCAHGVGTPQKGEDGIVDMKYTDNDDTAHSTRCVYDLWYWGEHDKMAPGTTTFTWGDVPRSEKAYAPAIKY